MPTTSMEILSSPMWSGPTKIRLWWLICVDNWGKLLRPKGMCIMTWVPWSRRYCWWKKSGQPVDMVVYLIIYRVVGPSQVVGLGISEASTVGMELSWWWQIRWLRTQTRHQSFDAKTKKTQHRTVFSWGSRFFKSGIFRRHRFFLTNE